MKTLLLFALICSVAHCTAAEPSTPKPLPPLGSQSLTRRISIKAVIDGTDQIVVQNGKVRIEHVDWERPTDISINGKRWKPAWTENNTDEFSAFSPPLAPFTGATITVKQSKGRGETTVVEQPSEANGQKLVIKLRDAGNGSSEFEVRITW